MHQLTSKSPLLAAVAVIASLLAMPPAPARAEGPDAIRSLAGCTANILASNDDGSTEPVPIGFTADFFGTPFTELHVNNNGNVTFAGPQFQFTPFDFTTSGDVMIAPFLADVDTSGAPADGSAEVTYGQTSVAGMDVFCVNWVDVGYFPSQVDRKNSFQLLLIDRGAGNFDIEFNYDKIEWETGDASGGEGGLGGTPAAVGFANGDGDPNHFFVREGSFENGALLDGGPKALTGDSRNSGQLGRYVFEVRNSPPTGARLTGEVRDPFGAPVGRASVEICRQGGSCISRIADFSGNYRVVNLPAGTYELTGHSAADGIEYADGHAGPVSVSGTGGFTQDVVLGDALTGPPPGTMITNTGESLGGIPVVFWDDLLTLTTEGCVSGIASYEVTADGTVVRNGDLPELPSGSGHYEGTIAPLQPLTGSAQVHIEIAECADPSITDFAIYIDPSGVVRDLHTGAPIGGATVALSRSADAGGPFVPVPDGSVTMSPSNRTNPDITAADGSFGWDVIAGFYKVEASAPGCESTITGALEIPPPVIDLDLRLDCGNAPSPPASESGASGSTEPSPQNSTTSVTPPRGIAVMGRVALLRRGRVRLRMRCHGAGPCRGLARLIVRQRTKRVVRRGGRRRVVKRPRSFVLGQSRFGIPAGKVKILVIKPRRPGRKLMHRLVRRRGSRGARVLLVGRGLRNRAVTLRRAPVRNPRAKRRGPRRR